MPLLFKRLSLLALVVCGAIPLLQAQTAPIRIHADLSDAARKLFHADIELPVHAGPLDLITPEWIPGAHGPDGPVGNIAGIRFQANGKTIPWRRDPVDTYEYHLDIPAGVTTLDAHLDLVDTRNATRNWVRFEWEGLLLYPAHMPVAGIAIQPIVTVPAGWCIGTSLRPVTPYDPQHPSGGTVTYAPTTVELLEDSPVMAGRYFHEYPLAPGMSPKHYLDVIGPTAASVDVSTEALARMSHLVREGFATYGPPHYGSYHFLVLLRSNAGGGGLEHHESSDNTVPLAFFKHYIADPGTSGILTHEFTHSWNGKFRRPDGLATPDYATPMQNNLLWVYEGLTNYMGDVLAERIGQMSAAEYRQELALTAAVEAAQAGRAWRSVEDTTFADAMPRNGGGRGQAWANWKRASQDYYNEGTLFWLDVDTTIRRLTDDKKSLRDFLLLFLQKGKPGEVRVEPYSLAEIEKDLNEVAPYDWAQFIRTRLYDVQPEVNAEGIQQAGYKLDYTAEPTPEMQKILEEEPDFANWFSLGIAADDSGNIEDVRVGSAADHAGLAPTQKIVSVNGEVFTPARLTEALKAGTPLQLMVQDESSIAPVTVPYTGGAMYPRLTRVGGTPDRLAEILTPVTPATP